MTNSEKQDEKDAQEKERYELLQRLYQSELAGAKELNAIRRELTALRNEIRALTRQPAQE